jgi:hypothetical protein
MVLQEANVDMVALQSTSPDRFVSYHDAQAAMDQGTRGIDINQALNLSLIYCVQYRIWRHLDKEQAREVLSRLDAMQDAGRDGSGELLSCRDKLLILSSVNLTLSCADLTREAMIMIYEVIKGRPLPLDAVAKVMTDIDDMNNKHGAGEVYCFASCSV